MPQTALEGTNLRLISELPKTGNAFYSDIKQKIEADLNFYQGSGSDGGAQERYNDAEHDYNNQREITRVQKSDGKSVPLFMVNAEKQVIKRYSGLIAGADDSLFVIPTEEEDEDLAEVVELFVRDHMQDSNFKFKKRKLANHFKRIGNAYLTTYYDPHYINEKYGSVGTVVQEVLPYHEVILDGNSRNSYDPSSPFYRNRQTRIKRLPVSDVKKIAENQGMPEEKRALIGQYQATGDTPNTLNENENFKQVPEDDRAYIFEYEYRELVEMVDSKGKKTGAIGYQYLHCHIINNNVDLILKEVTENPINQFMIEVACIDDRDDTPYGAGLMEETREHRELEAEVMTAQIKNAKSGRLATLIETRDNQSNIDERFVGRLNDPDAVLKINKGDIIHDPPTKVIDPVYSQMQLSIQNVKQDIGGEHNLQAGKQSFASETGKLANILNSRADLSKSEDIAILERVLSNSLNAFYMLSKKFLDLDIIIPRLYDDGTGRVAEFVRTNLSKQISEENSFDIKVKIDLNSEAKKAANQVIVTANVDIISSEDRLALSGAQFPKLLHKHWLEEQGMLQLWEFMQTSPENAQALQLAMQGIQEDQERAALVEEQLNNSPQLQESLN